MATEPTKSSPVVLRPVRREPLLAPKDDQSTGGLGVACPAQMTCPHCQAAVPLAHATPLSRLPCPSCGGKLFAPGRLGAFLLHGHIGEGEMGSVYRATDESLGRDVAIKIVRGSDAKNPASCERLRSEACAAGRLNHSRVAQVYALNFSSGHPYLVMELVSGQNFSQKLAREGRIDERTALRMALDMANGLSALNRAGLIHGDLKPGNIVLDRDGNAKLVDFGLSGMMRKDGRGALVGTPNYLAPELLMGASHTHRSDIYSLGATLYHLLSGQPPLDGERTAEVQRARFVRRPIPLGSLARSVSLSTQRLVMRMLEPDPDKRPANGDAVAADIREALARLDEPPPARNTVSEALRLFLARLRWSLQPTQTYSRRHASIIVTFGPVIVGLELLIGVQANSFPQTWSWLLKAVAPFAETPAPSVLQPRLENAAAARDVFSIDGVLCWQSMNLGGSAPRGSTLRTGETLIIQGPGTDMLKGDDRCRFVWTKATNDYTLSARVKSIADSGKRTVTGLLVKGDDPACGPGLLFGFLGSGELFLQSRQPNSAPVLVRRSERPVPVPSYLKITRRGQTFEACVSSDGRSWEPFASCELALPADNTVGFSVSAQEPAALATGTFSNIRLL